MQKRKELGPPPFKAIVSFVLVTLNCIFFHRTTGWDARMMKATATSFVEQKYAVSITDWTKPFCQSWSASDANTHSLQPFDLWHMHHPNWIVTSKNDDKFCVGVQPTYNSPIIRNIMLFYASQFLSSCKLVHTRYQWSSGWSADFWNINLGLIHALYYRVPCIITLCEPDNPNIGLERTHPWHYTAKNKKDHGQANQSSLVCEAGDTTCYVLPYHGCGPIDELKNDSSVKLLQDVEDKGGDGSAITDEVGWSAYLFITRKQLWIRRAVFDYKENFKRESNWSEKSDCTVMHVRRSDVGGDRYYYPVAYYVEMIPEKKLNDPNHYVFLLTDDSGAIQEAHEFFPHVKWKYFDRPRHNGSSGGFENQTPSGDPAVEVIVLLTIFDLVQDCSTLVQGPSGFTEYVYQHVSKGWVVSFLPIVLSTRQSLIV